MCAGAASGSELGWLQPGKDNQATNASPLPKWTVSLQRMAFDEQLGDDAAPTIFDKILSKEIPSTMVYEDDIAYAFRVLPVLLAYCWPVLVVSDCLLRLFARQDINPTAPVHILVVINLKLLGTGSA